MTYAMHVASGVSDQRKAQIQAQTSGAIFGDAINWGIGDGAFVTALDIPDLGKRFRQPFRSSVPVLLISATLDGRTSESDARAVGRQFQDAFYVTIDGASHDFFAFAPPRLISIMDAFLRSERVRDERITVPSEFHWPD
jgi:pimeloyl-ACP methyl ester carboxylesterase